MKLEVGMYARTNKGTIFKINSTLEVDVDGQWYKDRITDDVFKDLIFDIGILERVEKASHNIIDLIEAGDYVNGLKITSIQEIEEPYYPKRLLYVEEPQDYVWQCFNNEDIKSIVTKEQFEAMAYKVVEEC